jgi:RND family efflux transporter MFP subunit
MKTGSAYLFFLGLLLAPAAGLAQDVPTAAVELRDVALTYPADSLVEAVKQATVAAQVQGRVVDVRVEAGDSVKRGQLLMRIDAAEAAQAAAASQAVLANAKAHYERTRHLFEQKFVSRAALDKAEADYKAARAAAGQAGAALSFANVTAPIDGVVSQRHTELGELAAPGRPLVTVYDPRGLRVVASIPQYKLAEVRRSLRAQVEFPESGKWLDAARVEVLPAADARTHTVQARVYLPEGLKDVIPGMFARAHFVVGTARKLLVPGQAVLRRGEVTAVYVADGNGGFQLRQVRLGEPLAGGMQEVLAGLSPGEKVALDPVKAGIQAKQAMTK